MSVEATGKVTATYTPEEGNATTILELAKSKFKDTKAYISEHKRAFANIGQIGGTAALIAGGASLMFSGIAANLTIAGIPLGIPLLVGGGVLLLAGMALQVAHHIEQNNLDLGEKIKGVLKETLSNLVLGTLTGAAVVATCAVTSLTNLIAIVAIAIKLKPLLIADINSEKDWDTKKGALLEALEKKDTNKKSSIVKALAESSSFADFIKRLTQGISEKAQKVVKLFDRNTSEIFAGIFNASDWETIAQTSQLQVVP